MNLSYDDWWLQHNDRIPEKPFDARWAEYRQARKGWDAALAQQAQPEMRMTVERKCYTADGQPYTYREFRPQQAQEPPPLSLAEAMGQRVPPTREQIIEAMDAANDRYDNASEPSFIVYLADAVLALFASKETKP